jgi:hypothetical protein
VKQREDLREETGKQGKYSNLDEAYKDFLSGKISHKAYQKTKAEFDIKKRLSNDENQAILYSVCNK